jgi:hypothetical protein
MALESTQSLTETSTRNLPGGKWRPVRKDDNLTAIYEPIVKKMSEPRRLTTPWASTACYRESITFHYIGYVYFGAIYLVSSSSSSSSSASATVHEELWPVLRWLSIGPDLVTFVSNL